MTAMTDEKRVSELLPCPFCGSAARIEILATEVAARCGNDDCTCRLLIRLGPADHYYEGEELVRARWNRRSQEPDGWRPIETAPKDGSEFIGGRWWQGRFLQDVLKFHPQDGKLRLIHSRYRHRMDADFWRPLPAAPIPQSNEAK